MRRSASRSGALREPIRGSARFRGRFPLGLFHLPLAFVSGERDAVVAWLEQTRRRRRVPNRTDRQTGLRRLPRPLVALFAVLGLAFVSGCATIPPPRALWNMHVPAPKPGTDRTAFNLSVYDNVGDWVQTRYYDASYNGADWAAARARHREAAAVAKDDAELYRAINDLLRELNDRHTRAQPASDFERTFWQRNVVLGWRSTEVPGATDGRRLITEVFPKSAAEAAGVKPGWILLACDGRPPTELLAHGPLTEGQRVRCDFLTEREIPQMLVIAARQITIPTYRVVEQVAEGTFLVRFDRFDFESAHWVREQVKAHQNAKALIFDVRRNPGGNLFALSSILGDIFPHAIAIGDMVHRGDPALWPRLMPQWGGPRYSGKVAVLVSRYTASAAEVFAQLVQENGRGIVVGEKSSGTLLTVVFWPLAGGGKLWLSVYDYHSPKGVRVEHRGVEPDFAVSNDAPPSLYAADDPVIRTAVDALHRPTGAPPVRAARERANSFGKRVLR